MYSPQLPRNIPPSTACRRQPQEAPSVLTLTHLALGINQINLADSSIFLDLI